MVNKKGGCAEKFRVVTVFTATLNALSDLLIKSFKNGHDLEQQQQR